MTCSSSSGKWGSSEVANLVFRIATVGLSLASAIMTVTSTQNLYDDAGRPAVTVSYGNYPSFRYAALADLFSALLQGVAICLEVAGKKKVAKAVELIDKMVLALTSTSAALLLAADEITSCGPPRGGVRRGQRARSACDLAGSFCGRVHVSSFLSLAGVFSISVSIHTRHATMKHKRPTIKIKAPIIDPPIVDVTVGHCTPPPCNWPRPPTRYCTDLVPVVTEMAPPCCGCSRQGVPCRCENPELSSPFFYNGWFR